MDTLHKNRIELIVMFLQHALDIILDNRSRNMAEKIVNGIKRLMESLFQTNKSSQRRTEKFVRDAIKCGNTETILETLPYFIMTSLTDSKTHKARFKHALPEDFNFLQDENSDMVMIPVGYGQGENVLEVGNNKTNFFYHHQPLDFVLHSMFEKCKA